MYLAKRVKFPGLVKSVGIRHHCYIKCHFILWDRLGGCILSWAEVEFSYEGCCFKWRRNERIRGEEQNKTFCSFVSALHLLAVILLDRENTCGIYISILKSTTSTWGSSLTRPDRYPGVTFCRTGVAEKVAGCLGCDLELQTSLKSLSSRTCILSWKITLFHRAWKKCLSLLSDTASNQKQWHASNNGPHNRITNPGICQCIKYQCQFCPHVYLMSIILWNLNKINHIIKRLLSYRFLMWYMPAMPFCQTIFLYAREEMDTNYTSRTVMLRSSGGTFQLL